MQTDEIILTTIVQIVILKLTTTKDILHCRTEKFLLRVQWWFKIKCIIKCLSSENQSAVLKFLPFLLKHSEW